MEAVKISAKNNIKNKQIKNRGENLSFYLMLSPFALLFILFTVLPVISSVVLSFFTYDMMSAPKFNGLNNYLRMFVGDEIFPKAALNTLKFSVITGPVSFFISFLLGWLINELRPFVRSALAFLFYAPSLAGNTLLIWQTAFSGDSYGYINNILISMGLIDTAINWFQNTAYVTTVIIIIQLWSSIGVAFLANIAGMQNVNPEMYEAGALDGIKTRWHELWYITLPSMKSILLFSAVMQIQATFSIGATIQTLAGYPSVDNTVDTIVTHLGDISGTRYEMGYAAAISVFLFLMMAVTRIVIGKVMDLLGK